MPDGDASRYLFDASSMIELYRQKVSLRHINRLVGDDRIRMPASVRRELRRRDDHLKNWADAHPECFIKENALNTQHLHRIGTTYADILRPTPQSADPALVAMAIHLANRIVVSDDTGVQAVCALENVRCLGATGFRRIERI